MADEKTTYLVTHEDKTERKITVPSAWKVTFGPAARGINKMRQAGPGYNVPLALRFYENETKQRAIFTDVISFIDMSIEMSVKKITTQEKQGFMECDGKRKATIFHATMEEWVNPYDIQEVAQLPEGTKVENFDVEFVEVETGSEF